MDQNEMNFTMGETAGYIQERAKYQNMRLRMEESIEQLNRIAKDMEKIIVAFDEGYKSAESELKVREINSQHEMVVMRLNDLNNRILPEIEAKINELNTKIPQ